MKKKIIGIILTLTMVLTMLPVLTLPTKAGDSQDLKVFDAKGNPAEEGDLEEYVDKDYYWDGNTLIILKSDLTVKGCTEKESIEIKPNVTNITFENLVIIKGEKSEHKRAITSETENLNIILKDINKLGEQVDSKEIAELDPKYVWHSGISGQNLTFTGNGQLFIYCMLEAIATEEESEEINESITFDKKFTGSITIEQYGYPENKFKSTFKGEKMGEEITPEEIEQGIKEAVMKMIEGFDATIFTKGDINILGGKLNVVSYSEGNLETKNPNSAIIAGGTLKIDTPEPVSVKSHYGMAAIGVNEVQFGKNAKNVTMYGSLTKMGINIGTLGSFGDIVTTGKEVLGGEVKGLNFKETDLSKVEKKTYTLEELREEMQEVEEETLKEAPKFASNRVGAAAIFKLVNVTSYYVDKDGKDVAVNALIIKDIANPETEDTSAMLIWAFAGLAALAVAAGIFVSRKQRD